MNENNFYTNVQHIGNKLLFRGVIDGKRVKKRLDYKPRLYIQSKDPKSEFKTLYGQPLEEIQFESINDCRDFKSKYKDIPSFKIYGDNRHEYSFVSEYYTNDVNYNLSDIVVAYIDIETGTEGGYAKPESPFQPITAITLHVGGKFWVFGYGNGTDQTYQTHREDVVYKLCDDEKDLIRQFIAVWVEYMPDIVTGWNACRSLIMGYVNAGYDFTYIINRMERLNMGEDGEDLIKSLSPWGWIKSRKMHKGKQEINFYEIAGVSMIDYPDMYKKFSTTPSQESYTLDNIANVEIGSRKIDYTEYENLDKLFKENYQKFIEYNIHDVELIIKIEAKNRLIDVILSLAYDSRVNYEDVFSQVRMWDTIIMNELKRDGIMMPPKKGSLKTEQIAGGFVKDPIPGLYKWVASFDFASLYPHLIMGNNISPETLLLPEDYNDEIDKWMSDNYHNITVVNLLEKTLDTSILKKYNLCLTPNKQLFVKDIRGFLPRIMDRMFKERSKYKKLMTEAKKELEKTTDPIARSELEAKITRYNNLQQVKKICLNSAFGACSNEWFRFFDVRLGEAITMSGQLAVRWMQNHLNEFICKYTGTNVDTVIAADTDSNYVTFEAIVNKAFTKDQQEKMSSLQIIRSLDKVCEKIIAPQIDKFCNDLADYMNSYEQKLQMKREALADKAIWVKKKNYMINIYNNEGVEYATPKLKIVGMAAIKSSTPSACRKRAKEAYGLIINKDVQALREFNGEFKKEFLKMSVQDIAAPLNMNGLQKYDGTGTESLFMPKTPPHVKGALVFNRLLKKMNLLQNYPLLEEGEKLKYVYLKEPNHIQSDVISFTTVIPKEFEIEDYIDYEAMYEKNYLAQITRVTNAIKWELEEISTLEGLFE